MMAFLLKAEPEFWVEEGAQELNEHGRVEAAVLKKACLQGWPLADIRELGC